MVVWNKNKQKLSLIKLRWTVFCLSDLVGDSDLNIIFYGVKESFINQPGVGLIDSGTKPETYIASNYFIVSITKSDGSKINLQVATGANDGGENIQAYLY